MGEAAGRKGVWAYVEGGMGRISDAIASSSRSLGTEIITNANVRKIVHSNSHATGVLMDDGTFIEGGCIVSACTPYHTFAELMNDNDFQSSASSTHHNAFVKKYKDFSHRVKTAGNYIHRLLLTLS